MRERESEIDMRERGLLKKTFLHAVSQTGDHSKAKYRISSTFKETKFAHNIGQQNLKRE